MLKILNILQVDTSLIEMTIIYFVLDSEELKGIT